MGAGLGAKEFSTAGFEQNGKPHYLVLGGRAQQLYYKRRVPPDLRVVLGQSSFTIRLEGDPAGSPRQRAALLSSWSVANEQAEKTLANARLSQRQLTPQEQLGVAGAWVPTAPIAAHSPDTTDREELVAMSRPWKALGSSSQAHWQLIADQNHQHLRGS